MFAKKKTLLEQAQEYAKDIRDSVTPHVESARDQIGPRLSDARDTIQPMLEDARDKAAPHVAAARDQAAPYVAAARDTLRNDVAPAVQSRLADARDQAAPYVEEARRRGEDAIAKAQGKTPPSQQKKRGWKSFLLVVGLAGAAAGVTKYVLEQQQGSSTRSWQSSYTPAPASSAGVTAAGGSQADPAGGTVGEAAADATDAPRQATTPDAPADVVNIDEQPK